MKIKEITESNNCVIEDNILCVVIMGIVILPQLLLSRHHGIILLNIGSIGVIDSFTKQAGTGLCQAQFELGIAKPDVTT